MFVAAPAQAIGLCGFDDGDKSVAGAEDHNVGPGPDSAMASKNETSKLTLTEAEQSTGVLLSVTPDAAPGTEVVESIVPCAFLESGAFGSFCADVSVYVMTDNGLVLCQVPMLALEIDTDADIHIERRDASTSGTLQMGLHLAGMTREPDAIPTPRVLKLTSPAPGAATLLGPAEMSRAVPTRPC